MPGALLRTTTGYTAVRHPDKEEPVEAWSELGRLHVRFVENHTLDLDEHVKKLITDLNLAMAGKPSSSGNKSDW